VQVNKRFFISLTVVSKPNVRASHPLPRAPQWWLGPVERVERVLAHVRRRGLHAVAGMQQPGAKQQWQLLHR
jgi:hypothetical protein